MGAGGGMPEEGTGGILDGGMGPRIREDNGRGGWEMGVTYHRINMGG